MLKVITAPETLAIEGQSIFLAGSIEQDTAENWQDRLIRQLSEAAWQGTILNPRRAEWDASWEQVATNPQFAEQVNWELAALENADRIALYFDPNTRSPISLLELGLFARTGKMIVYCPTGFWRKGNVDIVCQRYQVRQVESFEELVKGLREG